MALNRVRRDVSSAWKGIAITPSDATVLPDGIRGVWVGGAGNIAVIMSGDTAPVTIAGVPAGTLLPIQISKVMATNTTATAITALY